VKFPTSALGIKLMFNKLEQNLNQHNVKDSIKIITADPW
jgi:hypothetical protein